MISQVRGWDADDLKAPQRLAISLGDEAPEIAAVAASDAAGVVVALSRNGGYWCWDARVRRAAISPARRGAAASATRIVPWSHVAAPPRPRRG